MRIAYHAESLIDAHLVKDALERAEIPAFIAGEFLTGAVGQLPARDFLAVMVPEAAAEEAEGIVRQVDARLAEARAAAAADDDFGSLTLPA
ncbi:putative signal transducing protein [Luteibacter sp. Lutesp34]|uniref:putative signal transducing protein n=1 Tax=Luteibacter sp. Lutesp34 TaxID=3243030 RepID=UPI0039B3C540